MSEIEKRCRLVLPYRMPKYERPRKLSWALFFDDYMGSFCLRHNLTPKPRKSPRVARGWFVVTTSENGASWVDVNNIEAAIHRTKWLDRRQKGRAIRKARRVTKMLVPVVGHVHSVSVAEHEADR